MHFNSKGLAEKLEQLKKSTKKGFGLVLSTGKKTFLYRILKTDSRTLQFVHVRKQGKWVYVGLLSHGNFKISRGTHKNFGIHSPEVVMFGKVWDEVALGLPLPIGINAYTPVRCKACKKWLIDMKSVAEGIGSECAKKALEKQNKELKDELDALYGMRFNEA